MAEYQLLPGAKSVRMPDGRTLYADRRGRIKADDRDAHAIAGSAAMRRYDAITPVAPGRFAGSAPRGGECVCGHSPWPWQRVCPRCGAQLGA